MTDSNDAKGFTLVELLICVAIVGILIIIAIPQFNSYRSKTYNSNAITDIRNLKTGMETFQSDCLAYPSSLQYR